MRPARSSELAGAQFGNLGPARCQGRCRGASALWDKRGDVPSAGARCGARSQGQAEAPSRPQRPYCPSGHLARHDARTLAAHSLGRQWRLGTEPAGNAQGQMSDRPW